MVPHSWLIECLNMFGVAKNAVKFLQATMVNWRTQLVSGSSVLGQVRIKRGIFQGDSLSPLLFVISLIPMTLVLRKAKAGYVTRQGIKINHLMYMDDIKLFAKTETSLNSLVHTVRVVSEDIGMEFGVDKCSTLVTRRGKVVSSEGIGLPDGSVIKSLDPKTGYKYLGISETNEVLHDKMKELLRKEYLRRVRTLGKTKLNFGNLIAGINIWAVSLLRYSGDIIKWTQLELKNMDRKTRKLLTMYGALHPCGNVGRIYLKKEKGGYGLISVEDCVKQARLRMAEYCSHNQNALLGLETDITEVETAEGYKIRKEREREDEWKRMALHGQFLRDTETISDDMSWTWLRRGYLKRQTASLILAAQDQALRTNLVKTKIDKTQNQPLCRMCMKTNETVDHIISGCCKLAQKEYKRRHDCVARALHWDLCKQAGFPHAGRWYEHSPEPVMENTNYKILWDFSIQTDHVIQARRPDLVFIDKKNKLCKIIDVAIPGDSRIESKEREKVEKYQDLAREMRKLWNVKVEVIPIVLGSLGTLPLNLKIWMRKITPSIHVETIQKSVLLGTARILRKVLEI